MADVCKGCDAPILWATIVPSGKAIPLDPEPVHYGNLVLAELAPGADLKVSYLQRNDEPNPLAPRYQAHFVTCSTPERFRKKKDREHRK